MTLDPGFSQHDCEQALSVIQLEINDMCCDDDDECHGVPTSCGPDCARVWYPYSQDCADFLGTDYDTFTGQCAATFRSMNVLAAHGNVDSDGTAIWRTTFTAERDVEYKVELIPDNAITLSALRVIAPHSHHVMASRFDASTTGVGSKTLQWTATSDEPGVEVVVESLSGAGGFDLLVTVRKPIPPIHIILASHLVYCLRLMLQK